MLSIYKPSLERYKKSVIDAIDSEWISNYGIYVTNAEDELKKILGSKYCILMNNGTAATHCLFIALKFKYPKVHKIYVPNNVFVAPWNCALMEYNKSQLEVMKINEKTMNIDTSDEYINTLEPNSCVLIVHNLGSIVNVPRLKKIRSDIIFIEDNCEGLFGSYEGVYSGTESLCSSASFYANKTLTTGEGGAFITNDPDIYKYIKKIYSHGMTNRRYIHDSIAYNYRMTNIQAAFLYDQLKDIHHILGRKRKLFEVYDRYFENEIKNGKMVKLENESGTTCSNWMYCIKMNLCKFNYREFENFMGEKKVQVRPFFYDIRAHEHLKDILGYFGNGNGDDGIGVVGVDGVDGGGVDGGVVGNIVPENGIIIPSYPDIKKDEQLYVANCIKEYIFLDF